MKINIKKLDWLILFGLGAVYLLFCFVYNQGNLLALSDLCYYNYFINALLHKRLDLIIDFRHDLSLFNHKWYMYWGPAPIIYVSPFYLVGRLRVSDVFYTLIAGIINIFLFYFTAKELIKYFKLIITQISFWVIVAGFALVSPNFYLSLTGAVWPTNQIVAMMYLLSCLWLFFKYLNTKHNVYLGLSLLFFNLAWLSRYTLIFYGVLYLFLLKDKGWRIFLWLAVGIIPALLVFFGYNYLRFGNILETGFRYQQGALRYDYFFKHNQLFSLFNFPFNFYYYFLHSFQLSLFPFKLRFDSEGNSVFLIYPLLVFNIAWWRTKIRNKKIINFRNLCLLSGGLILFLLLLNVGTGWRQFGNRYFFDVIPLFYLLLFFVISNIALGWQLAISIYGILINTFGYWVYRQQ